MKRPPKLALCGYAASRCAGPASGCPAAFGLVLASPRGGAQRPSGGRAGAEDRGHAGEAAKDCAITARRSRARLPGKER